MRRLLPLLLLLLPAGCPTPPQTPPPPAGGIRLEGDAPADALVTVDEHPQGTVGQLLEHPLRLRPGTHRLEIEAAGWFPWYAEVTVGDAIETVRVELRPVPP